MTPRSEQDRKPVWRGGIILAVLAAVCTALVAYTHRLTAARIEQNEQAYLEQSLEPALANLFYDNKLTESTLVIDPPHSLPGNQPVTVYRVFKESAPVAALFVVTASDGFSGPIRLLVGIDADGRISAVRVLDHKETPGLGDRIESSRSDWIQQFTGASLGNPEPGNWAIRRDGGAFDQLTGASITPRAVVKAVKETLVYFEENRDAVFAATEDTSEQETP